MTFENHAPPREVLRSQDAEELANSLTHAFGLVLSVIGTLVLLEESWNRGSTWLFAACSVYGATLVALYLASTLSHVWHRSSKRRLLRMLDQGCIFLLIAGSFTPLAVGILTGRGGGIAAGRDVGRGDRGFHFQGRVGAPC